MKMTIETLKAAFDNDLEITIAVAESLISSKGQLHSRLVAALKAGASGEIKSAIHAIKGAISVFGESALYSRVRTIDESLKQKSGPTDYSSVRLIPDEFIMFVNEIENTIKDARKVKS